MKVISSNETIETQSIIQVEVTIITQEADPVTIITKGKETKTETETTTDEINIDKTTKTKITATPKVDTTPTTKSDAEKTRHTRLTLLMTRYLLTSIKHNDRPFGTF
jgi:hypothetical protein